MFAILLILKLSWSKLNSWKLPSTSCLRHNLVCMCLEFFFFFAKQTKWKAHTFFQRFSRKRYQKRSETLWKLILSFFLHQHARFFFENVHFVGRNGRIETMKRESTLTFRFKTKQRLTFYFFSSIIFSPSSFTHKPNFPTFPTKWRSIRKCWTYFI